MMLVQSLKCPDTFTSARHAKRCFALAIAIGFYSLGTAQAIDLRGMWAGRSDAFVTAMRAGAGFSFSYNGARVGPEFPGSWRQATTVNQSSRHTTTYTHESGLIVTRTMRVLADFGAVEYQLRFKNSAATALPPLSAIHALHLEFGSPVLEGTRVVSSGGGLAEGVLPPRSFAIRNQHLAPTVPGMGMVELSAEGGRSSNKDLPFFFVHNDDHDAGVFIGFGWSGQWEAMVHNDPAGGILAIRGKIPDLNIALEPGEEIEGPTVLVGTYQGALTAGSNQLRRVIRDVYTPKLAGQSVLPVALFSSWWHVNEDFSESLLKDMVDGAAAIDQEYFEVDAAWYAGASKDEGFSAGLGNWHEVDRHKLPNGLKPVADYARSKGLKFGLWFEPERVVAGSRLAREHPDWILWDRAGAPDPWISWWRDILPDAGFFKREYGLLDYGRPEVQEWAFDLLDHYIREYQVKYVRYDFNINPLAYWNAHDQPNRRGITQLRHVQGLYAVLDRVRARHPDVILEGCASGGRRIDLETARRFHTFFISDATEDPAVVHWHLFGINYFLPGNYHGAAYILPLPHQKNFQADDLGFQRFFGGGFGTGGRIDRWPATMQAQARRHVAIYKELRRYLVADYYPLSPQPADLQTWSGWQFHDPEDQSGFMQAFRMRTAEGVHQFVLQGLEPLANYQFTDVYGGDSFVMQGAVAMAEGIAIKQETMSSQTLKYRKIEDAP